jgi:hypothetical protein
MTVLEEHGVRVARTVSVPVLKDVWLVLVPGFYGGAV